MLDAREIARHLVRIGCPPDAEDDAVLLTPLHLQKVLYYCQGWHLALLGEPLFRQPIEAWKNGPVVRDVYDLFARSREGITPAMIGEPSASLSTTTADLLLMVWRECARLTPLELADKTHREPAWAEKRVGLPPDARSDAELSLDTMRAYFAAEAKKLAAADGQFPPLDPAGVWQADRQLERSGGRGIPAAEAMRRAKAARVA